MFSSADARRETAILRLVAGCDGTASASSHGRTESWFSVHSHERIGTGSDEGNFPGQKEIGPGSVNGPVASHGEEDS